jgi:hypothetical protein
MHILLGFVDDQLRERAVDGGIAHVARIKCEARQVVAVLIRKVQCEMGHVWAEGKY